MKARLLLVVLFTGLLSTAAPALTKSDYDRNFKFSGLRTWDFKVQTRMPRDPVGTNSLWGQRISRDLEQHFTADGFQKVSDGEPSFMVAYYMGTKQKYDLRYFNYGFPGHWGRWHGWGVGWGDVDVWKIPYTESTLVLDVIDPHTNTLIWRGYDTETIDFNKSEKSINKAADNLVKRFAHEVKEEEKQ
jgi:Domain of unknown function (DUF4136)